MRYLVAVLLALSSTAGAAAEPDLSAVVRLVGVAARGAAMPAAQACPIAPGYALTNTHVAEAGSFTWSQGDADGVLEAIQEGQVDRYRDLVAVRPRGGTFAKWYPVASAAPRIGEKVWFVGYDLSNRDAAYAPRVFESKVVRIVNGNLVMQKPGIPGSSGSCVLNAAGEVVAINRGGQEMDDKSIIGIAVGVWGVRQEIVR